MDSALYNLLPRNTQQELLLAEGVFLADGDEPGKLLYQLDGFYVEVSVVGIFHRAYKFVAFDDTERLEMYLDAMDLAPLLQEIDSRYE